MSDEPFQTPDEKIEPHRPTPRGFVETLWTVRRDQHVMTCLIVEAPVGEELRVLVDGEPYVSEMHRVHDGLVGRANTLRHALQARGWTADSQ